MERVDSFAGQGGGGTRIRFGRRILGLVVASAVGAGVLMVMMMQKQKQKKKKEG